MFKINNINSSIQNNKPSFKSAKGLTLTTKAFDIFLKSQENLSSTRFIQDTATNWFPKAIVSRSKEDFAEMSFLEFIESGIFYFALPVFGEKLFRNKVFKNFLPKNIKSTVNEQIPNSIKEISNNKSLTQNIKNSAITTKAGILLACTMIPVAEYILSFAKNYFTLKTFKKSNFNSIANLDKTHKEKEDTKQQERVEKSAKKEFKKGAIISFLGIIAGLALALKGKDSKFAQNISKAIIEPGQTIGNFLAKKGIKNQKLLNALNSLSLDFSNNNGKLGLGKGQLALTAIVGLFGYSKAAGDRGKLDKQEVWTRVPLVVFYTIFGSELFESAFTKILAKKNIFPNLIKKTKEGKIYIPQRNELPNIAKTLANNKKTAYSNELSKLIKQKGIVSLVPYLFSLIFMGFSLSLITRIFTQYRYNKQVKTSQNENLTSIVLGKNIENFEQFFKKCS